MRKIGIGIAGLGTIGLGVYKHLEGNRRLLTERLGLELTVTKIADLDPERPRTPMPPRELFTSDWHDLIDDPEVQVVVELMGGIKVPYDFVTAALEKGKIVVTANKALLAERGKEIFALAAEKRVPVFYEAAAAGGVPIIKALKEAFVANHIRSMHGIINGTSNYILTRMSQAGLSFEAALKEAQSAGYAEADPTLDINGWDAAHKAIILASLAYGFWVDTKDIHVEGIQGITAADIEFAEKLGYKIKLLGVVKSDEKCVENCKIEVRVHPTLIPKDHVLASVNGVFNAVAVNGDVVGETLFYGRGAGQDATASAVISDIAEAAVALEIPRPNFGFVPHGLYAGCKPIDEVITPYYLRLAVVDRPGVLALITGILSEEQIGISSVIQPESSEEQTVPLVLMLHSAAQGRMNRAAEKIAALDCVQCPPQVLRVETFA
ncbi:MAG: homoserine dehydrogenase [Chthoniobacteraceae bacterium]